MTTQEFDALDDRAVDALIAEKVMGWKWWFWPPKSTVYLRESPYPRAHESWPEPVSASAEQIKTLNRIEKWDELIAHYSADLNACHEMEIALYKDKGTRFYAEDLMKLTGVQRWMDVESAAFCCAHATARQKCKAALMAVGIIKDAVAASGKEDVG